MLLALISTPAGAVDHALILNDDEKKALVEILDIAVKSRGLEVAPNAVYLLNKLKAAPVVTEQKPPAKEPEK